jgi:hypothetical protein
VDNRAASVAAFKGIQRSPQGRQYVGRTRNAHHTHTRDVSPPYPVQRQAFGGRWAGPAPIPLLKTVPVVFQTWMILVADEVPGADIRAWCDEWQF